MTATEQIERVSALATTTQVSNLPRPRPLDPPAPQGPFPHPQVSECPTCRKPVLGLLAGCTKPRCRAADIAYDWAIDRRSDI